MSQVNRFVELLARARQGDEQASAALAEHYEPQVRMVARARLGAVLRPYLDSIDLVQSVHRSLMLGIRSNRFDIATPERLIALAVTIVRRKVARHWRRMRRQQRLDDSTSPQLADLVSSLSASDPAEIVALRDQTEQLFAQLNEDARRLIELRLEGYTTAEIARRLGCDAELLRVRLHRLRKRLKERGLLSDLL